MGDFTIGWEWESGGGSSLCSMLHWSVNASASLHHFHHFFSFSLHGKLYFLQSTTYEELDEDDYVDLEEEENNFRSPHRDPITQAGGQKL